MCRASRTELGSAGTGSLQGHSNGDTRGAQRGARGAGALNPSTEVLTMTMTLSCCHCCSYHFSLFQLLFLCHFFSRD